MPEMIEQPYEVGRSGETAILVSASDLPQLQNVKTYAQLFRGGKYFAPRPLQELLKFLYDVEEMESPVPWKDPNGNSNRS